MSIIDPSLIPTTTEEWWDVDGWPLHTYATSVTTLAGREGIAPRRGANVKVARRPGTQWIEKVPDERKLSLAMTVSSSYADGSVPKSGYEMKEVLNMNLDKLKSLFGVYDRQIKLTRRLRMPSGRISKRSAMAEASSDMPLSAVGNTAMIYKIVVDLTLADPFWYEDEKTLAMVPVPVVGGLGWPWTFDLTFPPPASFPPGSPTTFSVVNAGNVDTWPKFDIAGPCYRPLIWNVTANRVIRLNIDLLTPSDVLHVDTYSRSVLRNGVTAYGALKQGSQWFSFAPGDNELVFMANDSEGSMTVRWQSAWQ